MPLDDADDGCRKMEGTGDVGSHDCVFYRMGSCSSEVMKKGTDVNEVHIYENALSSNFLGYSCGEMGHGFTVAYNCR